MYGLRGINNNYVADGSGRDLSLLRHQEFVHGRAKAMPYLSDQGGRLCFPRKRLQGQGPLSPTRKRITEMYRGERTTISPKASMMRSSSDTWIALAASRQGLDPTSPSLRASQTFALAGVGAPG
eukprot:CAMPEP_0117574004 /NCGR_PEP_ID=MMETSP0784-20121206/61312_1 /TAXON_ID=39447 /ORGANISM="" /LENGTH=123 /DNA_ID=CAMNT_0005372719 /DNA_START=38 /DNA_END=406 /DNA_ORIENTATION=-